MKYIDAHIHLWNKQNGWHNGKPVYSLENGRSMFDGAARQMMPPYMVNGENTVEMLLSNMDYAGVSGAVAVQEVMDGNQDAYLLSIKKKHGHRIKICSLYEEHKPLRLDGFDGIKLCACKLARQDLTEHIHVFEKANAGDKFIAIDLAEGGTQTGALQEIIHSFPSLKIAIGHFGMVTRAGWEEQIKLARNQNVFIESGGITWLFNREFYPYPSAVRAIREAADICGFEKLMWGSDYPRTMVQITYKMSFDFISKSHEISQSEKELFFYRNAFSFYGFKNSKDITPIQNMLED